MINTKEKAKEIKDLIDNYLDKITIINNYKTNIKNIDNGYGIEIEYSKGNNIVKEIVLTENYYLIFEQIINIINKINNIRN